MNESNRQKKIAGLLQNDLATLLQKMLRDAGQTHIVLSVSKVHVTSDLSVAKVHVSVFPAKHAGAMLKEIQEMAATIRYQMAQLTRDQLRRMPELNFYLDDSLDYIEGIDNAIKGKIDPIKDPDLLGKRKKS